MVFLPIALVYHIEYDISSEKQDTKASFIGSHTPIADLTRTLADFFEISIDALTVPDKDSDIDLMHNLFALEDIRNFFIGEIDDEICLQPEKSKGKTYHSMLEMLSVLAEQTKKLEARESTREDFERRRYNYPQYDTTRR